MLKLKHKHHLDFPHLQFNLMQPMQLSPVMADDDELSQAIDRDQEYQENDWELAERPDSQQLENFWSEVQRDVRHDPDWVDFSRDQ